MDALIDLFASTQAALYEGVMQPMAFALGLGNRLEDVFNGTGWLLVGLIQIVVMVAVIGPLQRWRPAACEGRWRHLSNRIGQIASISALTGSPTQ